MHAHTHTHTHTYTHAHERTHTHTRSNKKAAKSLVKKSSMTDRATVSRLYDLPFLSCAGLKIVSVCLVLVTMKLLPPCHGHPPHPRHHHRHHGHHHQHRRLNDLGTPVWFSPCLQTGSDADGCNDDAQRSVRWEFFWVLRLSVCVDDFHGDSDDNDDGKDGCGWLFSFACYFSLKLSWWKRRLWLIVLVCVLLFLEVELMEKTAVVDCSRLRLTFPWSWADGKDGCGWLLSFACYFTLKLSCEACTVKWGQRNNTEVRDTD